MTVLASAEAVGDGVIVLRHDEGEIVFEDPQRALDAARNLMDAAQAGLNLRAGAIAEARALVGSASHHMDRGAASAFHYDRRVAALEGPPIRDLDEILDNVGGTAEGGFAPGDSPVTGTSQASIEALEGRHVAGVGAFATPPGEGAPGAGGGPVGTVSPEPPGEPLASQGEGATPKPLGEVQPEGGEGGESGEDDVGSGAYEDRTKAQLQAAARKRGVSGAGSKQDIIDRLRG